MLYSRCTQELPGGRNERGNFSLSLRDQRLGLSLKVFRGELQQEGLDVALIRQLIGDNLWSFEESFTERTVGEQPGQNCGRVVSIARTLWNRFLRPSFLQTMDLGLSVIVR